MCPGVAGRSERKIGLAVGVGEVMSVADADRAVVSRVGRAATKGAALAVERGRAGARPPCPVALLVGHEAEAIGPLAIVEAGREDLAVVQREDDIERDVDERIAVARTFERLLEDAPFLDRRWHILLLMARWSDRRRNSAGRSDRPRSPATRS